MELIDDFGFPEAGFGCDNDKRGYKHVKCVAQWFPGAVAVSISRFEATYTVKMNKEGVC